LNHLIRDCDFHEKRMARKAEQNQFVPSAVLTRTGIIPVNTARTSGTKNFSTVRQSVNKKTVLTSTAMKVNIVEQIVNRVRPNTGCTKSMYPNKGGSLQKEGVSTDRPIVSTDGSKVSTDRQIEGTDEQVEGTEEHNEGTEEHIEGIEVQIKSTDGQRKGTEDHTED
ncbi:hypothetical protein Tco_0136823, partial [Tanacetum coccineum]